MSKNPHDVLFRWAFSDLQRVKALLPNILPSTLAAMIAWDGVQAAPVVLVDKDLSEKRTDLVWSLPLSGRSEDLHLILEHQSRSLRPMALRLLDYAGRVWAWWSAHNPRAMFLPPVAGLVLSNDPSGWNAPTHLWDLRRTDPQLEAALGGMQPDLGFFLEDLSLRAEQDILDWKLDAVGKLTLLLLKEVPRHPDIRSKLLAWAGLFARAEPWEHALPRFVCYIMSVKDDVTAQELNEDFRKMLGKRAGDIVMTEAERLRAEGEKRGEKRGLEQGVKQGLERGVKQGLELMFERRLGRKLAGPERETLSTRFTKLGLDRLGDVVLESSSEELTAWLEDPNAK
jgi:hypothetical protein